MAENLSAREQSIAGLEPTAGCARADGPDRPARGRCGTRRRPSASWRSPAVLAAGSWFGLRGVRRAGAGRDPDAGRLDAGAVADRDPDRAAGRDPRAPADATDAAGDARVDDAGMGAGDLPVARPARGRAGRAAGARRRARPPDGELYHVVDLQTDLVGRASCGGIRAPRPRSCGSSLRWASSPTCRRARSSTSPPVRSCATTGASRTRRTTRGPPRRARSCGRSRRAPTRSSRSSTCWRETDRPCSSGTWGTRSSSTRPGAGW